MIDVKYKFWKEEDVWLGYIEKYSDYWTQGASEEELQNNLREIYFELTNGNLPAPRQTGTLKIA